ncbi:MAG: hypothetical protein FWF43_02910 [Propionibacteriaceae bacterium]|nr:hypothetical protein [Propionibacteriaceae bacterium]
MKRRMTRLAAVIGVAVLSFSLVVTTAQAEDLNAEKQQADANANQAQANVNSAQAALAAANASVQAAQDQVVAAQTALVAAQAASAQAQADEAQKAIELYQADQALKAAQDKVAAGQAQVDAQKDAINAYARSIAQDDMPLVNIAMLINADSTASLANRIQWSDTVLTTNAVNLDQLRTIQQQLIKDQNAAQAAQVAADQAQQAAEAQAEAAQSAQDSAQDAENAVAAALATEQSAQDNASQILANNQSLLTQAQAVQNDVNARIVEQAREEEAARQAAAQAAAAQAAAAQAAAAAAAGSSGGSNYVGTPSPGAGSLSSAQAQSTAYGMIQGYGWGDTQFRCLVYLWNQESGWRWNALNPSSGAYGIPQSLPASKMAAAGSDWRTNAVTQMSWGLNYIAGRYGTPCGAWSHEQGYNWY